MVTADMDWCVEHKKPRWAYPEKADDPQNWGVSHRKCSDESSHQERAKQREAALAAVRAGIYVP
jgi:hypothetical protein